MPFGIPPHAGIMDYYYFGFLIYRSFRQEDSEQFTVVGPQREGEGTAYVSGTYSGEESFFFSFPVSASVVLFPAAFFPLAFFPPVFFSLAVVEIPYRDKNMDKLSKIKYTF